MELPHDFSESQMFTVPDNWDLPACIGAEAPPPRLQEEHGSTDAPTEEFTTCLVEEELPEGNNELQPQRTQHTHQEMDAEHKSPPSPPLPHPEHLNLIFEVRSMVDDQIFRAVHVS